MGIQRLHSYCAKYFSGIWIEKEFQENMYDELITSLQQKATYLVDVTNLVHQTFTQPNSSNTRVWDAFVPQLMAIAMRGVDGSLHATPMNTVILFHDPSGEGKDECLSFVNQVRNRRKQLLHRENNHENKKTHGKPCNSSSNVTVSECRDDSADRAIFLAHRHDKDTPTVIVSNDSDMLVYALQNIQSSEISLLCRTPYEKSLFLQRVSTQRKTAEKLRFSLLDSRKLDECIPIKFLESFVFHFLLLIGTLSDSTNVKRQHKRSRETQKPRSGFSGILSYHKNDITMYHTLYESWKFLLTLLRTKANKNSETGALLVHQTDTTITINLVLLHELLVRIGPSVYQGCDSVPNAEKYLRAVAASLHFYTTGNRTMSIKADKLEVPSLSAVKGLMKQTADSSNPKHSCLLRIDCDTLCNY